MGGVLDEAGGREGGVLDEAGGREGYWQRHGGGKGSSIPVLSCLSLYGLFDVASRK